MPDTEPTAPGLTLRQWREEDAGDLVSMYADPVMRRWVRIPIADHAEAAEWVAAQHVGWRTGHRWSFAVVEAERLVGCVVLKERREVGYWTAAWARGRGIASRAVAAVSDWAFATLDVVELALRHQIDNEASCRVAIKTGFRLTATLPATEPSLSAEHLHVLSRRGAPPAR